MVVEDLLSGPWVCGRVSGPVLVTFPLMRRGSAAAGGSLVNKRDRVLGLNRFWIPAKREPKEGWCLLRGTNMSDLAGAQQGMRNGMTINHPLTIHSISPSLAPASHYLPIEPAIKDTETMAAYACGQTVSFPFIGGLDLWFGTRTGF